MENVEALKKSGFVTVFDSPTFNKDGSFHVDEAVGSASISPSGRDVVLASRQGLHIIDLDDPYSPPRHLIHRTPWEVADVQWSPFSARDYWVVSTSNQKALVWNLELSSKQSSVEHVLHAHTRAITDINFSAHGLDLLATCAVDSFVHCWDLRTPARPSMTFADWFSGATQVKWNRQDQNLIASSHDKCLHIWDTRKGAYPLRTLQAHATKIYGIDWSRVKSSDILTCSLDMTIKFWDFTSQDDAPTHVIRTPYPVWRARHTPFGYGVLAMPQRGDHELHLYDKRRPTGDSLHEIDQPIHSFSGHHNQVKEFLWRSQGSIQDGVDHRMFQLVSWSTDRNLLLHRLDENVLEKAGHRKGRSKIQMNVTRQGATYRTFHTDPESQNQVNQHIMPSKQGLSTILKEPVKTGMKKIPIPLLGWGSYESGTLRLDIDVATNGNRKVSPIAWMKGVKISRHETYRDDQRNGRPQSSSTIPPWNSGESFGSEVTRVGERCKKVTFEKVNILGRSLSFSLNGPWGNDEALVHLKLTALFPKEYPDQSPGDYSIEKTSSIPDSSFIKLRYALKAIGEAFTAIRQGSLEAVARFLLGERTLEETLAWASDINNGMDLQDDTNAEESSSDEDEDFSGAMTEFQIQDLESSGNDLLAAAANANANVPLPKACGACWARDDRLICFFPSKSNSTLVSTLSNINTDYTSKGTSGFESFGRLHYSRPGDGDRERRNSNSSDSDSSEISLSSSNTSQSSEVTKKTPLLYRPSLYLQGASERVRSVRSLDRVQSSGAFTFSTGKAHDSNTFISIQDLQDILPAKKVLAEEYILHGNRPAVCHHNSEAAARFGYQDLANIWKLIGQIICDQVPLEIVHDAESGGDDILVLAKRSLVHIQRRDSGLDLAFDDPDSVANSTMKGRVKWGSHPFGNNWLIDLLFDHFEKLADIQMLAMLTCVLDEHLSKGDRYSINQSLDALGSPLGFSLDYFPSIDIGWSVKHVLSATLGKGVPQTKYSALSYPSSFIEQDSSDNTEVNNTPSFSVGHTPPLMTQNVSRSSPFTNSFSSSPEQMKRSNSLIGGALAASLSKPFSFIGSASPPAPVKDQELSTSAPSSAPTGSVIPWGRNRSNDKPLSVRWTEKNSSAIEDSDSPVGENEHEKPEESEAIISIKNQTMFDDEACLTIPLLSVSHRARHNIYRDLYAQLLYAWGLPLNRCEVLKFNQLWKTDNAEPHPSPSESVLTLGKKSEQRQHHELLLNSSHNGLEVSVHCSSCGECILPDLHRNSARCPECDYEQSKLACSICYEAVVGLYKSCLQCGHVSHFECHDQWLLETSEDDVLHCESGCGCVCTEHSIFDTGLGYDSEEEIVHDELQEMVRSQLALRSETPLEYEYSGTVRRRRMLADTYSWF